MKIISINAGSSSLKFSLFDMNDESVIASGNFERIGIDGSLVSLPKIAVRMRPKMNLPAE